VRQLSKKAVQRWLKLHRGCGETTSGQSGS
jgi:hypothetical protein